MFFSGDETLRWPEISDESELDSLSVVVLISDSTKESSSSMSFKSRKLVTSGTMSFLDLND